MHNEASVTPAAEYFAAGVPPEHRPLARIVYGCVAHGRPQYVSTEAIRQRARRAGVYARWSDAPPAYGTIARVLDLLRASGRLYWQTAYVRRWHLDRDPEPDQPVVRGDRLPARRLMLAGIAATVATFSALPAPAPEACSIEALHLRAVTERSLATEPATAPLPRPCFASIEQASGAGAGSAENVATVAAIRDAYRRLWPDG